MSLQRNLVLKKREREREKRDCQNILQGEGGRSGRITTKIIICSVRYSYVKNSQMVFLEGSLIKLQGSLVLRDIQPFRCYLHAI